MDIWLKKSTIEDIALSNQAICVYIGLQMLRRRNLDVTSIYVSVNYLCYELSGHNEFNRRIYNNVKVGLNELIESNKIHVLTYLTNGDIIVDANDLGINTKTDKFIKLGDDEISTIISSNTPKDKFGILRYFTVLIGSMNHKMDNREYNGKLCGFTAKELSRLCGFKREQIISSSNGYNKFLEDIKLIYVYRSNDIHKNEDNELRNFINVYSRYCDKDIAFKFGHERDLSLGVSSQKDKGMQNNKNYNLSMNKKYKYLITDSYTGKYTKTEIAEILEWARSYNLKESEYKAKGNKWTKKDIDKIIKFL